MMLSSEFGGVRFIRRINLFHERCLFLFDLAGKTFIAMLCPLMVFIVYLMEKSCFFLKNKKNVMMVIRW